MNTAPRRWPWATALIAALALMALGWNAGQSTLVLDRAAVQRGEIWRWWTGTLVHFGPSHLGWNLLVFVASGAWVEILAPGRARIFFALAPAAIGAALLAFAPALEIYGGLSGVAAGAVALLAFTQLSAARREDRLFWWAVLALLAAKIAAEFFSGQAGFVRFEIDEVRVVPLAHLAGVACAALVHFTRRPRAG